MLTRPWDIYGLFEGHVDALNFKKKKSLKLLNIVAIFSRVFIFLSFSWKLEKAKFLFYSQSDFKDKWCFAFLDRFSERDKGNFSWKCPPAGSEVNIFTKLKIPLDLDYE